MPDNKERVVTIISEEAYKQNTVYRPWVEIKASKPAPMPEVPAAVPQWYFARR